MPLLPRVIESLEDALALAFPVACAGCDAPDEALCPECRRELAPRVRRRGLADGLPAASGLEFDGVTARVVRALKEDGRTGLARSLAPALAAAVGSIDPDASAVVVAVPASRAALRRRGYRVVELVARRAGLRPARLLRASRVTADQRGLTREDRRRNVAGSMRATGVEGLRVVVVDDVVTTGASLDEAVRALRHAGADVIGAATIAATVRMSRPRASASVTAA